jgi:hypothetical protein
MTFPLEYHDLVKRPVQRPFPSALFMVLLLPLVLVSLSPAQHDSASASSSGSGHSSGGTASVGSFAHTGSAPANSGVTFSTSHSTHTSNGGSMEHHHHHRSGAGQGDVYYPYVYAVPFPYVADAAPANTDEDDDDEYQGGPTIFDRRGSGRDSYIPPTYEGPAHARSASDSSAESNSDSEPPRPPTTLVFKDGHQLQVENYAIVSQTLYDLTRGHPRKIALADLDLPATEKQNDNQGVTFQLPPSAQAN